MTDYLDKIIELATPKSGNWRNSDCPVVKTYRKETDPAWKDALKYSKLTEEALFEKCRLAIQAQAIFRRDDRSKGGKPAQPKMLSAWLRAGRWEGEIPSHSELKQRHEAKFCAVDNCNEPTHGPRFSCCTYHLANEPDGRMRPGVLVEELRNYAMTHTLNHKDAMETLGEMLGWKSK